MQRKKSQHNETLKEFFENITILRRNLINTLKTQQGIKQSYNGVKYKGK